MKNEHPNKTLDECDLSHQIECILNEFRSKSIGVHDMMKLIDMTCRDYLDFSENNKQNVSDS